MGGYHPSTIIDCTGDEPVLVREGLGKLEEIS
jgi:tRNA A37 threonylcarbamoyladenosine synthetase subunit TsaC/SUA5/YrdC